MFNFDPDELAGIASFSAQQQYLQKFGFVQPPIPEGYSHGSFYGDDSIPPPRITPPPSPQLRPTEQRSQSVAQSQTGFGTSPINGGEQINRLVAKRSNKKRVQPLLISNIPSASTSDNVTNGASNRAPLSVTAQPPRQINGTTPTFPPPDSRFSVLESRRPSHSTSPAPSMRGFDADIEMAGPLDLDVPIDAIDASASDNRAKRKASAIDEDDRPTRARTLGGDMPRTTMDIRVINRNKADVQGDLLPVPSILTLLSTSVDDGEDVLEGKNSSEEGGSCSIINLLDFSTTFAGPSEVQFVSRKQTQWLDYLPSPVIALTATSTFCAVATLDCSVNVYSLTGRRYVQT